MKYPTGEPFTFAGLEPHDNLYESAAVAVLPIPYEATTSFAAGTRNGPREILHASRFLELYDEELEAEIHRVGICTVPELECTVSSPADMVRRIHSAARGILDDGKFLVSLGGEHTITPPLVEAHLECHPGLSVLAIDAHADLRSTYQGSDFSHACAMRRVLEMTSAVQVGIRSISVEETAALPSLATRIFYAHQMGRSSRWQSEAVQALKDPVYVTIDLDGLDPALMPAVGTPEPGGLDWFQLLGFLKEVTSRRRVVGFDVNELAPIPGLSAPNFTAAKLVYKLLGYVFAERVSAVSTGRA